MEIYDLKNKQDYLREVMELEYDEWATNPAKDREKRINKKIHKYFENIDNEYFCKLILLVDNKLIGFKGVFENIK